MNRSYTAITSSRGPTVYTGNPNDFGILNISLDREGEEGGAITSLSDMEEMFNDNGIHKAEIN